MDVSCFDPTKCGYKSRVLKKNACESHGVQCSTSNASDSNKLQLVPECFFRSQEIFFFNFALSGFIWDLNQGYPTSVGPDTHQVAVKMTPYRHKCSFMLPKMCQ